MGAKRVRYTCMSLQQYCNESYLRCQSSVPRVAILLAFTFRDNLCAIFACRLRHWAQFESSRMYIHARYGTVRVAQLRYE
jgi:hypothetical protein